MNAGKTFFDLTLAESVPAGSLYAVEMGDGSGTKSVTHEKVVESVGKSLPLGDIKNLQTIAKDNFVNAINEIKQKSESGGSSIDDSKIGDLSSLTTIAKDNLVNAINEVASKEIDVLDTKEEIEANTESGKTAGALALKEMFGELNNNLGGCQLAQEGEDFYIVGADSVRKKLGSGNIKLIDTVCHNTYSGATYTFSHAVKRGIIASGGKGSAGSTFGFISKYTNITINKIVEKFYSVEFCVSAYEFTDAKAGSTVSFIPSQSAAVIIELD